MYLCSSRSWAYSYYKKRYCLNHKKLRSNIRLSLAQDLSGFIRIYQVLSGIKENTELGKNGYQRREI
jgi:hypothetical protein